MNIGTVFIQLSFYYINELSSLHTRNGLSLGLHILSLAVLTRGVTICKPNQKNLDTPPTCVYMYCSALDKEPNHQ